MSQEQFAHYLQVGRSALAMIESGRSGIDAERLAGLGQTLGVDVRFVMSGERGVSVVAREINWDLVEGILKGLHRWATKNRIKLTPEKTARALRVLYQHFAEKGAVDDRLLDDTMDMAA